MESTDGPAGRGAGPPADPGPPPHAVDPSSGMYDHGPPAKSIQATVLCLEFAPIGRAPVRSKAPGPRGGRVRSPSFAAGEWAARRMPQAAGTRLAGAEKGRPVLDEAPGAAERAWGEGRRIPDTHGYLIQPFAFRNSRATSSGLRFLPATS